MPTELPRRFKDRYDAARQLLPMLTRFAAPGATLGREQTAPDVRKSGGQSVEGARSGGASGRVVILAIPRGGLELGFFLARELGRPLDVALVKKLAAPGIQELAVGAVALDGSVVIDAETAKEFGADADYLARERAQVADLLRERDRAYHAHVPRLSVAGATVLLVDDGIATGLTVRAAIESLKKAKAGRIVVVTPVASTETVKQLRALAEDVVTLLTESPFYAVGTYYDAFPQVSDAEAVTLLEQSRDMRTG